MNNMHEIIQELHTIMDWVRWSVTQFEEAQLCYGHGFDNAWDEALYLILRSLYLPVNLAALVKHARLTQAERCKIAAILLRRIEERMPTAYLLQEAFFAGLNFYIDQRVLIPRSPIAELIEQHFSPWIKEEQIEHILEIGTGSGCIAIATALALPHVQVDATDISSDALEVAKINIEKHYVMDQVYLYTSNVFENLATKTYDIIISNPPYVSPSEIESLPIEYKHEPMLALQGGMDGLEIVKSILKKAYLFLKPHGILIVEVGNNEEALQEAFPQVPFTWLEFEKEGGGVFLLTYEQLVTFFR